MRRKQLTILFTLLAVILSGCQFGMVESVQIVTDPVVEVALGTREGVFSEAIDLDGELENLTDPTSDDYMEGLTREDLADGETITLTLQQDMIDISINDFAGENLELDAINQTIDEVTFTVPEITSSQSISMGLDPIDLPVSTSVPTISITSIPEVDGTATESTPTITASGYTTMTFATGTLYGNIAVNGGSGGQSVQVTSATIMDGTTAVVTASNTPITATDDLEFDLSGVTLPSSFTMELGITVSAASGTDTFDLDATFSFSADSTVSAATGIEVDESVTESATIPVDSTDFISAEVGAGTIDIDLTFDSGWTNLDSSIDMIIYQDSTAIAYLTGASLPVSWDLSNVDYDAAGTTSGPLTIGTGDLTLDYTVYLETTSGETSDFAVTSGVDEVSGTVAASLDSFSEIVMEASGLDFEQTVVNDVDTDITDLVSVINFDIDDSDGSKAEISISLVNDLPTGSDITVTLDAPELEINSESQVFTANTVAGTTVTNTWDILPTDGELNITPSTGDLSDDDTNGIQDIDFTLSISMSNYDDTNQELTLSNVSANETYSLSGDVAANLEIDSVEVNTVTIADQYPENSADALDFSMLGDVLPDSLTFPSIAAALEFDFGGSSSIGFYAIIYAEYTGDSGTEYLNLVGTNEDVNGIPQTAVSYDETTSSVDISALGDLINDRASGIIIYYDVDVTGAEIFMDDSDDQRVSAAVTASIPLELYASADAELVDDNGDSLIPAAEEDLFGRDGSADDDDINDYLDMLSSASMEITFENDVTVSAGDLLGIGFSMIESTTGLDDFDITENFTIEGGTATSLEVELTRDQIDRMIEDDSFEPAYSIYFMGPTDLNDDGDTVDDEDFSGYHKIVEGFDLDITVTMEIESDVDYTIDLGGDE